MTEAEYERRAGGESGECSHYWLISPQQGAVSLGTCKLCGDKREFKNAMEFNFHPHERNWEMANQGKSKRIKKS